MARDENDFRYREYRRMDYTIAFVRDQRDDAMAERDSLLDLLREARDEYVRMGEEADATIRDLLKGLPVDMDGEAIRVGDVMTAPGESCWAVLATAPDAFVIEDTGHDAEGGGGLRLCNAADWDHCLGEVTPPSPLDAVRERFGAMDGETRYEYEERVFGRRVTGSVVEAYAAATAAAIDACEGAMRDE